MKLIPVFACLLFFCLPATGCVDYGPRDGWAHSWGGISWDDGNGVAVDYTGNVYVAGSYCGSVDFDTSSSISLHSSTAGPDSSHPPLNDAYLSKFNSDWEFEWVLTWGNADPDSAHAVAVDSSGNILVTGAFKGSVDLDPGPGTDIHTSSGNSFVDAFLMKLGSSGEFEWARTWGGSIGDVGLAVAVDDSGDALVTGYFMDTVDFDPGPLSELRSTGGYQHNVFLAKFNSEGEFQWVRTWGGDITEGYTGNGDGTGVAVGCNGDVYVTGTFYGTIDFDPGPGIDRHSTQGDFVEGVFLSKFDSNGEFHWARNWHGQGLMGLRPLSPGVSTDGKGYIFVTGGFNDSVDFDPGPETEEHISIGNVDVFLSSFDTSGGFQWVRTWGGPNDDWGLSVAASGSGNVYVTGLFGEGSVDFDPGPGTEEHTSNAKAGAFLSVFDSDGDFRSVSTWVGTEKVKGRAVTVDNSEDVIITGNFSGTVDFDPGLETDNHTARSFLTSFAYDVFLIRLTPDDNR